MYKRSKNLKFIKLVLLKTGACLTSTKNHQSKTLIVSQQKTLAQIYLWKFMTRLWSSISPSGAINFIQGFSEDPVFVGGPISEVLWWCLSFSCIFHTGRRSFTNAFWQINTFFEKNTLCIFLCFVLSYLFDVC